MIDKFNNPKFNILIVFVFEIIGCSITFSADYSGAGMAAIIIKWIPAFMGLATIIIYVISRFINVKYNWLITLIGIVLIMIVAINIYLTDYT